MDKCLRDKGKYWSLIQSPCNYDMTLTEFQNTDDNNCDVSAVVRVHVHELSQLLADDKNLAEEWRKKQMRDRMSFSWCEMSV